MTEAISENEETSTASEEDFAALDFEATLTSEQAHKFGGEVLADHCVTMRMAAVTMARGKSELLQNHIDAELAMMMVEKLTDLRDFINALGEMQESALARWLCIASNVSIREKAEAEHAAA